MFAVIQTTLLWINYLSYVHLCKQLRHMKIALTVFLTHTQSPEIINQIYITFTPIRTEKMIQLNSISGMLPTTFGT